MSDSQNKAASLTNKSSSTQGLEKAQKNPISSKTKVKKSKSKTKKTVVDIYQMVTDKIIDVDAETDVSMSEDMYDYLNEELPEKEDFKVWFFKEFKNIGTEYPALASTNFVDYLKGVYDDERDELVAHHKAIFDDLIESMDIYCS